MLQTLKNDELTIKINTAGAEMTNITDAKTGFEYLWQGDPAFWKRHSPVLFPIVGSLWNGEYRFKDKTYKMSQHGFARDKEFTLTHQSDNELQYTLTSDAETNINYPFDFELRISYKLTNRKIEVSWQVLNRSKEKMYFQIGAHPAFNYPHFDAQSKDRGYFKFDTLINPDYILIGEKGCADTQMHYPLILDSDGLMKISNDTFDKDALIIENNQVKQVSLLGIDKKTWLTLSFDAPLVGLWSPPLRPDCPFVCIEPWYGRCDRVDFCGDIKNRDYMNSLEADDIFMANYSIEIA